MNATALPAAATTRAQPRATGLLLNAAHALDHMFLLIFAAAIVAVARDFGFARWEDLLPYSAGAFIMFGLGSLPAGKLGDALGRRRMMLVFFFGIGAAALATAATRNVWQMAAALTVLGAFAAIYHPVGIPMLLQGAARPGTVIGTNGLAGNLGIALAALITGLIVKWLGWRWAFALPGLLSIGLGVVFWKLAPAEHQPPAKRRVSQTQLPRELMLRVFLIMTVTSITGSLLFNFTTNGNQQLLAERFAGAIDDPAKIGLMLAAVYAVASLTQLVVGALIDRFPMKRLLLAIVALQAPLFLLAIHAHGMALLALMTGFMITLFGAIPFTDAMIVRYVDDSMRSRVSGMRMAVSFGISSLAVALLGPVVKATGFATLLFAMGLIALVTLAVASALPNDARPAA